MEYHHGGDIYTHSVDMDFSANINPLGLPKQVKEAVCQAVDFCTCYPDSRCGKLKKALSLFHQISSEEIICGNGAAELIFLVVQAVRPKRAMLFSPSFLEYEKALKAAGSEIIYFDLTEEEGFRFTAKSFQAFLENSKEEIQMVFLCNPNNPTGLALERGEMKKILDCCGKQGIFCVVDECFQDFLERPEEYSIMEEVKNGAYGHVFLLKAFTKIYAMAGLRLGYGMCGDKALLEEMEGFRQPWSVSSLAQAAGEAALKETEYVKKTRELIRAERLFLSDGLRRNGFTVWDSMANYIFFRDTRPEALKTEGLFYNQCLRRRVLIRSCGDYRGLDGTYYRICVKRREENEAFLKIITEGK